jgi:ubiquinone/menaquinone biosynthesis C-methylase UbiE
MGRGYAFALGGLAVLGGVWYWERTHPSALPYSLRFFIEGPHPGIPLERLVEILEPRAGEHLLELGPGTGYYTLDVAERLGGGTLDVLDVQQEMLDHVMREAGKRGLANIKPTLGDAGELPYDGDSFDGAFLVTVLGEVPDQDAVLRELARVLRPAGRLVVGESWVGDPHVVTFGALQERAAAAGFEFERRLGSWFAYFARHRAPSG